MSCFSITICDWTADREQLVRGRYGVIETAGGKLVTVHLRPWPMILSWQEIWPTAAGYHLRGDADRCLLYFNQPRSCPNYLALKYIASTSGTSVATCRAALAALDALAELKRIDAIVCDAANRRISDRLLARWGWEAHAPSRWRRNFIKRFYGVYPGMLARMAGR